MASYPAYGMARQGSSRTPANLTLADRTADGTARVRNFQAVESFDFVIVHPALTSAEADAVHALWAANKATAVSLAWHTGENYAALFTAPPERVFLGGGWWRVTSRLSGEAV